MSVETFDLKDTINFTSAAAAHFSEQLGRGDGNVVRISLKESGCSGFMYVFEEAEAPLEGDVVMSLDNNLVVCLKPADAMALRGSEIDYTREGLNQNLKINNPNVKDACGCGASFNIDLERSAG